MRLCHNQQKTTCKNASRQVEVAGVERKAILPFVAVHRQWNYCRCAATPNKISATETHSSVGHSEADGVAVLVE